MSSPTPWKEQTTPFQKYIFTDVSRFPLKPRPSLSTQSSYRRPCSFIPYFPPRHSTICADPQCINIAHPESERNLTKRYFPLRAGAASSEPTHCFCVYKFAFSLAPPILKDMFGTFLQHILSVGAPGVNSTDPSHT